MSNQDDTTTRAKAAARSSRGSKEEEASSMPLPTMSAVQYAHSTGVSRRLDLWLKKMYPNELRTFEDWKTEFFTKNIA